MLPDDTAAAKIRDLDEVIEGGITSTTADGHSATQDLDHLQKVRRELRLQDPASIAAGKVKPAFVRMNLRGAW